MSLFQTYEEDYADLRTRIEQRIRNIPSYDATQRRSESQVAETEIKEAEQLIRSMNLSAKSVPNNSQLMQKVRDYENEISKLRISVRKAEAQMSTSDRSELFSGFTSPDMSASLDQRERLLNATEKLDNSTNLIKQSQATANETVEVGVEIMENLDKQKRQMVGMRENLSGIEEQLSKAKVILQKMARRVVTNKLIMAGIVLVLFLGIGIVVYVKWFSGSGTPNTPTTTTSGSTGHSMSSTSTSTSTSGIGYT